MAAATAPTGIAKYVPGLAWLPNYNIGWLRFDLIAGLTTAAMVIHQSIAYATIAMQSASVLASVVPDGDG